MCNKPLPAMRKSRRFGLTGSKNICFCCSGWIFAALMASFLLAYFWHRIFPEASSGQRNNWELTISAKKQEFNQRWMDARPLNLIVGDSHIEIGDWYSLFFGAFSIRNCGVSRAKINDLAKLVSSIGDRQPSRVILMCGVNNLGAEEPIDSCIKDYEQLIAACQTQFHPQIIVVLSVMPVRESRFHPSHHRLNRQILQFNRELRQMCRRQQVVFIDTDPAVTDDQGGLSADLTTDGLHLNHEGYRKITALIKPVLAGPGLETINETN
jgi:hypothetical protein